MKKIIFSCAIAILLSLNSFAQIECEAIKYCEKIETLTGKCVDTDFFLIGSSYKYKYGKYLKPILLSLIKDNTTILIETGIADEWLIKEYKRPDGYFRTHSNKTLREFKREYKHLLEYFENDSLRFYSISLSGISHSLSVLYIILDKHDLSSEAEELYSQFESLDSDDKEIVIKQKEFERIINQLDTNKLKEQLSNDYLYFHLIAHEISKLLKLNDKKIQGNKYLNIITDYSIKRINGIQRSENSERTIALVDGFQLLHGKSLSLWNTNMMNTPLTTLSDSLNYQVCTIRYFNNDDKNTQFYPIAPKALPIMHNCGKKISLITTRNWVEPFLICYDFIVYEK